MNGYTNVVPEKRLWYLPDVAKLVTDAVKTTINDWGSASMILSARAAQPSMKRAMSTPMATAGEDMPDGTPIGFSTQIVNGWTDVVTDGHPDHHAELPGYRPPTPAWATPEFGEWQSALQQGYVRSFAGLEQLGRNPLMTSSTILWAADLITEEGIRQGQHMPGWTSEEADQLLQDFLKNPDPEEQKRLSRSSISCLFPTS